MHGSYIKCLQGRSTEMNYADKIRKYFLMGIYKESHIEKFFEKNILTEEEYLNILSLKEVE